MPRELWRLLQQGEPISVGSETVFPNQVMGPPRPGLSLVYSGDTAPCPALEQAAAGADLLIHEATYGAEDQAESARRYGHSTFAGAAALARRAQARCLWLTHFSHTLDDPEQYLPDAQALFPQTQCGRDGMRTTLRFV